MITIKIDKKLFHHIVICQRKRLKTRRQRFSSMKNPTKEIPILDLSKSTIE